eukprot:3781610-Rhodomonas_salina.1
MAQRAPRLARKLTLQVTNSTTTTTHSTSTTNASPNNTKRRVPGRSFRGRRTQGARAGASLRSVARTPANGTRF